MQIGAGAGPGSARLVAGRAHPVDTGVEPVRARIHNRASDRWTSTGANAPGDEAGRSAAGSTAWGGRRPRADATLDLATVWHQIRERLAKSLSPQQNAMLNLTRPLGLVQDTAVLAAPNEFTQTVLESRMRRVLSEALSERFGRDIRVAVQLEDAPQGREPESEEQPTRRPWSAVEAHRAEDERATRDRADDGRSAFGVRATAEPVQRTEDRFASV